MLFLNSFSLYLRSLAVLTTTLDNSNACLNISYSSGVSLFPVRRLLLKFSNKSSIYLFIINLLYNLIKVINCK